MEGANTLTESNDQQYRKGDLHDTGSGDRHRKRVQWREFHTADRLLDRVCLTDMQVEELSPSGLRDDG
jgi:hypothetical protein